MIKIGRKYLKIHRCPDCGKIVFLVRHPQSSRCAACHKRYKRHNNPSPSMRNRNLKYSGSYKRRSKRLKQEYHYCALCGTTKNLTCHHCVDVKTHEWKGKHLTILCQNCHRLWEAKVSTIRSLSKEGKI